MDIWYNIMDVQSQGNVVHIDYRLDDGGIMVKFLAGKIGVSLLQKHPGPTHPRIQCVPGAFLHASKLAGLSSQHSPPSEC